MSEWISGYRQALANVAHLARERGIPLGQALAMLLADLDGDALAVEREQDNRMRHRRLRAAREAQLPLDEPQG